MVVRVPVQGVWCWQPCLQREFDGRREGVGLVFILALWSEAGCLVCTVSVLLCCSVSHMSLQLHHTLAFWLLINLSVFGSEGSAVSLSPLDLCCSPGPQGSSQGRKQRGKSHLWDPEMYEQFSAATLWEIRLTVRCRPG